MEPVDSLRMSANQATIVSYEPKVIGAAFNPNNRGKVVNELIEGVQGVYVIKVDNVTATALGDANVAEQRISRYQQAIGRLQQMTMQGMDPVLSVLREAASIKDNRSKHF